MKVKAKVKEKIDTSGRVVVSGQFPIRSGKLRTRKLRNLLMHISTEFSQLKYEAEYRHNSVLAIFNVAAGAMLKCSYKFI